MLNRGGLYASLYQRQFLAQPTAGQEAAGKLGERKLRPAARRPGMTAGTGWVPASDLPGGTTVPSTSDGPLPTCLPVSCPELGAGTRPDWCLLLCLLLAFPPAGIAYWILTARRQAHAAVPDRSPLPGASAG